VKSACLEAVCGLPFPAFGLSGVTVQLKTEAAVVPAGVSDVGTNSAVKDD
jgi:hypothetical protein